MASPKNPSTQQPLHLVDYLKSSSEPALRYASLKRAISYRGLHNFVQSFVIPTVCNGPLPKLIIAIILPNGPLLAATIVAVSNRYIAAPINPGAGPDQVKADIELSGASAILSCALEASALQLNQNGLQVFCVEEDDEVGIRLDEEANKATSAQQCPSPNRSDDIAMILFTSGTSGNRKVVPITVGTILHGVQLVIDSWGLTEKDICLNMMPLYHV
jgi:acyl-coenzyme A synthetase/AMP-(fatty) acid ligase